MQVIVTVHDHIDFSYEVMKANKKLLMGQVQGWGGLGGGEAIAPQAAEPPCLERLAPWGGVW